MTGYFPGANPFAPDTTPPLDGSLTLGDWLRKSYDPSYKPQPYVKPGGIADYADLKREDYADLKREDYAKPPAAPPTPPAVAQSLPPQTAGVQSGASSTATPRARPQVSAETFAGLGARAYQSSPEWGGVRVNGLGEQGSDAGPEPTYRTDPLLTQGQMAQDFNARGFINARHDQAMGGIEEYSKRNDPQREAIEGRTKTLIQERLMPEFSGTAGPDGRPVQYEPSLRLNGVEQRQDFAPKGRTVGDIDSIESYIARNPKISAEQDRQRSVQELRGVIGSIQADQKKPPAQREAEIAAAVLKAAQEGALAVGDFQALAKLLGGAGGEVSGEFR